MVFICACVGSIVAMPFSTLYEKRHTAYGDCYACGRLRADRDGKIGGFRYAAFGITDHNGLLAGRVQSLTIYRIGDVVSYSQSVHSS